MASASAKINSAADDTPEQLRDVWDGAVERSRARLNATLANSGLDESVHLTRPSDSDGSATTTNSESPLASVTRSP